MKFITIWQPSFRLANAFVKDNGLENFFVQFVEDVGMIQRGNYWIVFKDMPDSVFEQLLKIYDKPRLIYL